MAFRHSVHVQILSPSLYVAVICHMDCNTSIGATQSCLHVIICPLVLLGFHPLTLFSRFYCINWYRLECVTGTMLCISTVENDFQVPFHPLVLLRLLFTWYFILWYCSKCFWHNILPIGTVQSAFDIIFYPLVLFKVLFTYILSIGTIQSAFHIIFYPLVLFRVLFT